MKIAIVESKNGNGWSYCQLAAFPILGRILQYSDEPGFPTADAAIKAAKADRSISCPVFKIIEAA